MAAAGIKCNAMHHTATHCNAPQRTATGLAAAGINCHALQHTAIRCNRCGRCLYQLQHTATHSNTLHHTGSHFSTLQHTATHYNTLQHTATGVAAAGIKGSCTDNSASVPDVGCCKGCQTHRTGCAKCVAVCCSVLQCVAVCCSVKLIELVVPSVLQCVAVCCSVLQCVAVCCNFVLAAFPCRMLPRLSTQRRGACCFALQCVAVCCCVLQCVAVRCCVLQCVTACFLCRMPQRLSNSLNRSCHVCCSVCCSVLQCVAIFCPGSISMSDAAKVVKLIEQVYDILCCSALQRVAVFTVCFLCQMPH